LFVGIKPEKLYSASFREEPEKMYLVSSWRGSKPPGSDHTVARAEAQTTCIPKTAAQTTYLLIYG